MTEIAKPAEASGGLSQEMQKMEYEPILSVEKKLITWSIVLGAGMLGFLYWLSITLFPSGH